MVIIKCLVDLFLSQEEANYFQTYQTAILGKAHSFLTSTSDIQLLCSIQKKFLPRRRPALCTTRLGEPCAILVRMPCAAPCAEALCGALCGHVAKTAPFFGVQASSWLHSIFLRRRLNNCVALHFASIYIYIYIYIYINININIK